MEEEESMWRFTPYVDGVGGIITIDVAPMTECQREHVLWWVKGQLESVNGEAKHGPNPLKAPLKAFTERLAQESAEEEAAEASCEVLSPWTCLSDWIQGEAERAVEKATSQKAALGDSDKIHAGVVEAYKRAYRELTVENLGLVRKHDALLTAYEAQTKVLDDYKRAYGILIDEEKERIKNPPTPLSLTSTQALADELAKREGVRKGMCIQEGHPIRFVGDTPPGWGCGFARVFIVPEVLECETPPSP